MKKSSTPPPTPPSSASHDSSPLPSPFRGLLALVCLTIVHRLRPRWVNVTLKEAAQQEGVNPQRLSRLASRAEHSFDSVVQKLTRKGRPRTDREAKRCTNDLAITKALLDVATSLLKHVSLRKKALRTLVVGAFVRLKEQFPDLTTKQYCQTLGLAERTFRHWRRNLHLLDDSPADTDPVAPAPTPKPPCRRPPRRPRFGFQCVLPETQLAADTTNVSAFGIELKIIATQDVGARDQSLLESVIVEDHENADLVAQALIEALCGREGMQVIHDHGTPYMAETTRECIEELNAEQAPQREYTPTDKPTVERAFETVKSIAGPLLRLTNRLAEKLPALSKPELAKAATTLVLTTLLKAYQAGARAAHREQEARQGMSREQLLEAGKEHREQARAEDHSKVLLLSEIHTLYGLSRPLKKFIRSLRRFPLEVLQAAERAFREQVHRDDIRDRASYYAAIVRRRNELYLAEQARRRTQQAQRTRQQQQDQRDAARTDRRQQRPQGWLREGLSALAAQWQPNTGSLLFGGMGVGRGWVRQALALLTERHGEQATRDIADGVFHAFADAYQDRIGNAGLKAVRAVLDDLLPQAPDASATQSDGQTDCTQRFGGIIFGNTGPPPRSEPASPLPTLAARRGGS
jgi:hypothetical protein